MTNIFQIVLFNSEQEELKLVCQQRPDGKFILFWNGGVFADGSDVEEFDTIPQAMAAASRETVEVLTELGC